MLERAIAERRRLLAAEMLRAAPPEVTGLPEKDYPGVGAMTADYLTGKLDAFHYTPGQEAGTEGARQVTETLSLSWGMRDARVMFRSRTVAEWESA